MIRNTETFICKLYKHDTNLTSIHDLRCLLFRKCKTNIDTLPPTKDALTLHIKRAHFQSLIWNLCLCPKQKLPSPEQYGWHVKDNTLMPTLMTNVPISKSRVEVKVCNCKETGNRCQTRRCVCVKNHLICTGACGCDNEWCSNPFKWWYLTMKMYNIHDFVLKLDSLNQATQINR